MMLNIGQDIKCQVISGSLDEQQTFYGCFSAHFHIELETECVCLPIPLSFLALEQPLHYAPTTLGTEARRKGGAKAMQEPQTKLDSLLTKQSWCPCSFSLIWCINCFRIGRIDSILEFKMRNLLAILLLFCLCSLWAQEDPLPSCYYSYDEVSQMLTDFQTQYPDIAKKVQIGLTQQDQLPIYALRISDNVDVDEEEPGVLFLGQVHAEEVLGVQITMSNIAEILAGRYQLPYSQWINQLDTWFVPTLNPEGHNVVTANLDVSYRKNKNDVNNNGIFDYSPLTGYDVDGVDINRNFSFNWAHGDTLWQPPTVATPEYWDYYRGPSPMSESENQALKALADEHHFVYSIVWHSSRTGNLSEKAYYPFYWKEVRPSPDMAFSASICAGVAGQIPNETGSATYEALPNLSRKGASHDWLYQQYGTFQILIECGTRFIQPDSLVMVDTVQRCSNATRWLLNRALPYSSLPSNSMLTGNIRDAVTNAPLEAEIIVQGYHAPWFRPRLSDPDTGRYWKALPSGTYTIELRKRGYQTTIIPNVFVQNLSWTLRHFTMQPVTPVTFSGSVLSGTLPLDANIRIYDPDPVDLQVNGNFSYQTFEGEYQVEISADGYYPYLGAVSLSPGNSHVVFQLSPVNVIFSESWENGMEGWQVEGPWVLENELSVSGNAITDSWGGWGFYAMNCDVWMVPRQQIYVPASDFAFLTFDSHLYTEYGFDFARVEASLDSIQWTTHWEKSGQHDVFTHEYVPLGCYAGNNVWLRFHLTDESIHVDLTDPGWTIDNIRVISGLSSYSDENPPSAPDVDALYPNYPNPFNPETTIRFALADSAELTLSIYNIKGQLVRRLLDSALPSGVHSVVWDGKDDTGSDVSSGLYLYRMDNGSFHQTRKMMLVK